MYIVIFSDVIEEEIENISDLFKEMGFKTHVSYRELAIYFWLIITLAVLLSKKDYRVKLLSVFKAVFAQQLIIVYLLSFLYTLLGVSVLDKLNLRTPEESKDLFTWMLSAGTITAFMAA